MDTAAITAMVEDFWRSFISAAVNGDQRTGAVIIERFDKQIDDMAKLMSNDEAASFYQIVEEQRAILFNEYSVNPTKLKARLGISGGATSPLAPQRGQRHRMGLGEVAVRTAVRATIWETVIALFRLGR